MILAIIQARVSSTRLPGKVLKKIIGKSLLDIQIERVRRSKKIDKLIVATSTNSEDDKIDEICKSHGIDCFRGDLNDVLDRFYQASLIYKPDYIIRLTGDCPLSDPKIIDELVEFHINGNYEYSSNSFNPTYPNGLDVEIFSFSILKQAWKEAELPSHREHVTLFIHRQPKRFTIGSMENEEDFSHYRWTVDEPEDFEVVRKIYEALHQQPNQFTMKNILDFLAQHPDISEINKMFSRNEGLAKSLVQDKKWIEER